MVLLIIDGIFVISAGLVTSLLWIVVMIKKIEYKFIEKKYERMFHIIAEFVMSLTAIVAGIALLFEQPWGIPLFYLAMGLILYALVNAIGIYKEKKYKLLVLTLIISAVIAVALVAISLALLSL
ncbi:MAG: hypothetical protein ACTSQF_04800 [Candidatus Heimdallarchaeaceae archaeon]